MGTPLYTYPTVEGALSVEKATLLGDVEPGTRAGGQVRRHSRLVIRCGRIGQTVRGVTERGGARLSIE